jgi:hypothetical protein
VGENMSLVTLNLPDWTANITIIIFVLAFGRIFIKKFTELLNNLLNSFEIEENIIKHFMALVVSLFWLAIFAIVLIELPILFTPNIFPVNEVGNLLLRFVGYGFTLILPIVILFFLMEYKKKK